MNSYTLLGDEANQLITGKVRGFFLEIVPENGRRNAGAIQTLGLRLEGDYESTGDACEPWTQNFEVIDTVEFTLVMHKRVEENS